MGAIARTVSDADGEVIGVIPKHLVEKEVAFTELTDLRVVDSMHQRKALMEELSDGFIASSHFDWHCREPLPRISLHGIAQLIYFDAQTHTLFAHQAKLGIATVQKSFHRVVVLFKTHHPAALLTVILDIYIDAALTDIGVYFDYFCT
jgi:hypothetical protein